MATSKPQAWSIYQFFNRFPTEQAAEEHLERMRWGDTPCCPRCGSLNTAKVASRKPMPHRCRDCRKHFSVRIGSIFEKAKLPLRKCLLAIYLLTTAKKGVSSHQLAKELGCTEKTAWYLGHRIRASMGEVDPVLDGEVEVDETFIGGKEANRHASKKLHAGRGAVGKQAVLGVVERGGAVFAQPIGGTDRNTLHSAIRASVRIGATLYTDEHPAYRSLVGYEHQAVKHSVGEYVRGRVHTNGVEGFWALLKRGYYGTHHWMSPKHLHRYTTEFASRHNRRTLSSEQHLNAVVRGLFGKSLPYQELIA